MAEIQFVCPYCKHEFYADEEEDILCPACGQKVKKDDEEQPFL